MGFNLKSFNVLTIIDSNSILLLVVVSLYFVTTKIIN